MVGKKKAPTKAQVEAAMEIIKEASESFCILFPNGDAAMKGNLSTSGDVNPYLTKVETTLQERGSRYGSFREHAEIAQDLQDVMRIPEGWTRLAPDQKQALTVIADKIARILNGDPNYSDNWHDIQGYAKLVEDRLNE